MSTRNTRERYRLSHHLGTLILVLWTISIAFAGVTTAQEAELSQVLPATGAVLSMAGAYFLSLFMWASHDQHPVQGRLIAFLFIVYLPFYSFRIKRLLNKNTTRYQNEKRGNF